VKKKWLAVSFFLVFTLLTMPVFATEIFSDGFESGDFSNWTSTDVLSPATLSAAAENAYSGTYALKATASDSGYGHAYARKDFTAQSTVFFRAYARTSYVEYGKLCGGLFIGGGTYVRFGVRFSKDSSGNHAFQIYYRKKVGDSYQDTDTYQQYSFSLDTYYCIELEVDTTNGEYRLYVDDSEIWNATGIDFGGDQPSYITFGLTDNVNRIITFYGDCVVVADAYIGPISGAQEKTFTLTETAQATATHVVTEEKQFSATSTSSATSTLAWGMEKLLQFQTSPVASSQFTLLKEGFYTATELVNTLASYILGKETTLTVKEYVKTETAQANAAHLIMLEKLFFQTATPAASALANMAKEATQVLHEFLETAHAQATMQPQLYTPTAETNLALVLAAFAAAIAIVALSLTITKKD